MLKSLGYNQLTHEPCIYVNHHGDLHEEMYLLCQVDDFAIACTDQQTADRLLDEIDSKLNADLKREGLLERHNGVDIEQKSHYIHINCKAYLSKTLQHKSALLPTHTQRRKPVPMKSDHEFIRQLETASGPTDHDSKNSNRKWDSNTEQQQANSSLPWSHVAPILATLSLSSHNTTTILLKSITKQCLTYMHTYGIPRIKASHTGKQVLIKSSQPPQISNQKQRNTY